MEGKVCLRAFVFDGKVDGGLAYFEAMTMTTLRYLTLGKVRYLKYEGCEGRSLVSLSVSDFQGFKVESFPPLSQK